MSKKNTHVKKSKKSLLNAIPPAERKWALIMLIIDVAILCIISYSYLFFESDYKTVDTNIIQVEWFKSPKGTGDKGAPAQIRFYTDDGMQFDFFVRGKNKNDIALSKVKQIEALSEEYIASITYVERENIVLLGTIFASADYKNVVSLNFNDTAILEKEIFEQYNSSSFWCFLIILAVFTILFIWHPTYCVISAIRKRTLRKKRKATKK